MDYDQDKVDEITLALLVVDQFHGSRRGASLEGARLGHDGATPPEGLYL